MTYFKMCYDFIFRHFRTPHNYIFTGYGLSGLMTGMLYAVKCIVNNYNKMPVIDKPFLLHSMLLLCMSSTIGMISSFTFGYGLTKLLIATGFYETKNNK